MKKLMYVILAFCMYVLPLAAQSPAQIVQAYYFQQDYVEAENVGKQLLEKTPEDASLKAWYVLSMAWNNKHKKAIEMGEKWTEAEPDNAWAWFALGGSLERDTERHRESVEATKKALEKQPNHPDFIWLQANIFELEGYEKEAISFIDRQIATFPNPAMLLLIKHNVVSDSLSKIQDPATKKVVEESSAQFLHDAYTLDSTYVPVLSKLSWQSFLKKDSKNAQKYAHEALQYTDGTEAYSTYWRAVDADTMLTKEERKQIIQASMDTLLAHKPNAISALGTVASWSKSLEMPENVPALEDRILEIDALSLEAEWIFVGRWRDFTKEHQEALKQKDPVIRSQLLGMYEAFVNRPVNLHRGLLEEAHNNIYFMVSEDSTASPERLLEVVQNASQFDGPNFMFPRLATTLLERTNYVSEAQDIIEKGFESANKWIENAREVNSWGTEENRMRIYNNKLGSLHNSLGILAIKQQRFDEAENEFYKAYEIFNDPNFEVWLNEHLGEVYEARYNAFKEQKPQGENESEQLKALEAEGYLNQAERYYIQSGKEERIKDFYQKRYGSLEGYDAYMEDFEAYDRERRYAFSIATRLPEPKTLVPFSLNYLNGGTCTPQSLKGKITVINIWGTWCGPCVKELPEVQALYEKYRGDEEIEILTLNNDTNLNEVKDFMQEKSYSFPILIDEGFLNEMAVTSYPTTWFLDKEGNIQFIVVGYRENLVEEFSWRIEALRE